MKRTKKDIQFFPKLHPDKERLWKNIESQILTDNLYREINREKLMKALEELPVIKPEKTIWNVIAPGIRNSAFNRHRLAYFSTGIAASLILLLSIGYIYKTSVTNKKIPYEIVNSKEEDVDVFLSKICANYPGKCKNPDFMELQNEIVKLQHEKINVVNSIFYNPSDEDIKQITVKIDNQIDFLKDQIIAYVGL